MFDVLENLVRKKHWMSSWLCIDCLEMKRHDAMSGFGRDGRLANQQGTAEI
jgi:hypothetical protein